MSKFASFANVILCNIAKKGEEKLIGKVVIYIFVISKRKTSNLGHTGGHTACMMFYVIF